MEKDMNKFICAAVAVVLALSMVSAQAAIKDRDHEIKAAITKLEKAKNDLSAKKSGDEYGGHREEAIKHLDAALGELHQALEYAHAHPQDEKHHG
jgi:hypothetical protein